MQQKQQRKKGGAKIGRNKVTCERYRAQNRRRRNTVRRVTSHVKRHPNDAAAKTYLDEKEYLNR